MPVEFTDRAKAALKRLLDQEPHEPGHLIRMVTDIHGHHHLSWDRQEPDDQVVTCQGEPVLVIKARIAEHLCEHHPGATLDVEEGPDGPALVLRGQGPPPPSGGRKDEGGPHTHR